MITKLLLNQKHKQQRYLDMASQRRLSTGSSRSKVSFDSSTMETKNERLPNDASGFCLQSNYNYANPRGRTRSWMTSYNAGSHFITDDSSECDSLPKRISKSNILRGSFNMSPVKPYQQGELNGIAKPSPTQSRSTSAFEHKHRGYSLINFFTLRILFVDMLIAVGDPISDFMQVREKHFKV